MYRPHGKIEHRHAQPVGQVHGAGIRGNAEIQAAQHGGNFPERQAAAKVGLRQARQAGRLLPQSAFSPAAQKDGHEPGGGQSAGQPGPEHGVRMFGGFAGAHNQPHASAARGRGQHVRRLAGAHRGVQIQPVQIRPVKCIVVIILRKGCAIELPVAVDAQSVRRGRRPQLERGCGRGQTGGRAGPAAQIDDRRVSAARQGGAMGRRKKDHLRRQGHQFLKKLRLGRHPEGMARPAFFEGQQQGKGQNQIPHALQLQNQQRICAHADILPVAGVP